MVFFVESNTKWAVKLNNQLRKCHELIGGNSRSNMSNKEPSETDDFQDAFTAIAEEVEQSYNFEEEIKAKKDQEKLRIIMDIQSRLSHLTSGFED